MRRYEATLDNGHEYITFEFESEHRANSHANEQDCIRAYRKAHGSNPWNRYIVVKDVRRIGEGE